ncbi:hypothetical protein [Streptomyces sp. NPDC018031]|uniref:hypothetical protein n=1 Tax=Streptomyces sp. NPDC018031 TaxID=3365033 RepID=UPI00379F5B9D
MTSTTSSDEHPEVAEISALAEGLLPLDRSRTLRRHLDDCPLCADVRTSLEEIRSLLGTLPGPVRMPADIAGRIDAALAAEALLDATAPGGPRAFGAGPLDGETADAAPGDPAVSRETSFDTVEADAGIAAEPGAASPPAGRSADRPAGRPRAATGPGRKTPRRGGGREGARRWPRVLLGTACAAAVIGLGTFLVQSSGVDDDSPASAQQAAAGGTDTKRSLAASELEGRVRSLLDDGRPEQRDKTFGEPPASGTAPEGTTGSTPLRAPEEGQVPSCVQAGTGRSETPIAAEQSVYDGTEVFIVVLPHPADSSLVDAFVIDASCTTAAPPAAGTQLLTRTYSRD